MKTPGTVISRIYPITARRDGRSMTFAFDAFGAASKAVVWLRGRDFVVTPGAWMQPATMDGRAVYETAEQAVLDALAYFD